MRINRFIAASGHCSRRKADELIRDGLVTINGNIAKLGDVVKEEDRVVVEGKRLSSEPRQDIFIVFHKPIGVISTSGEEADNTVFDYVNIPSRLFYVGRLDVASSGLMLLTNNGDVANKITSSRSGIEKEYLCTVTKPLTRDFIESMRRGVILDDGQKTKPARVKTIGTSRFKIVLTEGKNRQIRRMCEALGYEVKSLKRTRIADIRLKDLGPGNWRHLTKNERRSLLDLL